MVFSISLNESDYVPGVSNGQHIVWHFLVVAVNSWCQASSNIMILDGLKAIFAYCQDDVSYE